MICISLKAYDESDPFDTYYRPKLNEQFDVSEDEIDAQKKLICTHRRHHYHHRFNRNGETRWMECQVCHEIMLPENVAIHFKDTNHYPYTRYVEREKGDDSEDQGYPAAETNN